MLERTESSPSTHFLRQTEEDVIASDHFFVVSALKRLQRRVSLKKEMVIMMDLHQMVASG